MIFVKNTLMVSMIVLALPRISTFFISVNLRKKKKNKKMETVVKIEKNIKKFVFFN